MSNAIKVGLVGIGRAGWGMHLKEIEGKEDMFKVVAVCDIIPERNDLAKERLGCRAYATVDELIKDEEVELVDIATRSSDHYEHARKALDAGKDVLLEKPACTNYDDFKDLLARSNQPGKPRLFFRQNRRFELGFNELRSIINDGLLGDVFELRLTQYGYQRRDDWQTVAKYGGGQMNNWGPHLIDHTLQLLDSPVARLSSNLILSAAAGDCEDHFSIQLTGENGRYATVSVSGSAALGEHRTYTAIGSKGMAIMHDNEMKVRYIDPEQVLPPVVADEETPAISFGKSGTFEAAVEPSWIEKTYELKGQDLTVFWNALYETYRNGKPFPIKDEEVDALMRVITQAKETALIKAETI